MERWWDGAEWSQRLQPAQGSAPHPGQPHQGAWAGPSPSQSQGGLYRVRENGRNGTVEIQGNVIVRTFRKTIGKNDVQVIPVSSVSHVDLDRRSVRTDTLTVYVGNHWTWEPGRRSTTASANPRVPSEGRLTCGAVGGPGRNRTGDKRVAVACLTTWPPGRGGVGKCTRAVGAFKRPRPPPPCEPGHGRRRPRWPGTPPRTRRSSTPVWAHP